MTRSIFKPDESLHDVQDALNKATSEEELKHIVNDRLRKNGWTREKELVFRDNAKAVGFILGSYRTKQTIVETPIADRYKSRLPPGAVGHALRNEGKEREVLLEEPERGKVE